MIMIISATGSQRKNPNLIKIVSIFVTALRLRSEINRTGSQSPAISSVRALAGSE